MNMKDLEISVRQIEQTTDWLIREINSICAVHKKIPNGELEEIKSILSFANVVLRFEDKIFSLHKATKEVEKKREQLISVQEKMRKETISRRFGAKRGDHTFREAINSLNTGDISTG